MKFQPWEKSVTPMAGGRVLPGMRKAMALLFIEADIAQHDADCAERCESYGEARADRFAASAYSRAPILWRQDFLRRRSRKSQGALVTLSKSDHKKRTKGVGSSEIGMLIYVAGEDGPEPLSPWGGRHKLWRRKTGKEKWDLPTGAMDRGTFLESGLIDWFAHDKGVAWMKPPTINHPKHAHVVDSCDGLTFPSGTRKIDMKSGKAKALRCIEAKVLTGFSRDDWGDVGTDEVPEHYLVQAQWHIGAWLPEDMACDFPVDIDAQRKDYLIRFDEELYLGLVDAAEKFWQDYVAKDVEPPVDDYGETATWLSKYMQQREGLGVLEADNAQINLLLKYKGHALSQKSTQAQMDEIKEKLMRCIGEYDGIMIPGTKQKILWRRSKDRSAVRWERVAEELARMLYAGGEFVRGDLDTIASRHTKISEGARRWTPTSLIKNTGLE